MLRSIPWQVLVQQYESGFRNHLYFCVAKILETQLFFSSHRKAKLKKEYSGKIKSCVSFCNRQNISKVFSRHYIFFSYFRQDSISVAKL